jgi:hypothetical protein
MSKNFYLILALGILCGCAAINKGFNEVAPDQVNAVTNQEIPGTHALTPTASAVISDVSPLAGPVAPFVMPFISLVLLGVNFFQKTKNGQLTNAITSTVQTIENAGNDPTLAPAIAILKTKLAASHQIAGVQPIINNVLSDLKLLPAVTPPVTPAA